MHTTVDADDGRFAGCCSIPKPRRGAPHVAHWVGVGETEKFLVAKLDPEAAIRLGTALIAAGKEVAPPSLEYRIGELPLGGREEDDDE